MEKTTSVVPSALEKYSTKTETAGAKKKDELDQQAFLNLMVTQLKNQDPSKPMDSAEFLGQIAQFSTVSGISGLQKSFATLSSSLQSSQALQASTMVGRNVTIPRDNFTFKAGGSANLSAVLPEDATNVNVHITDSKGQAVYHENLKEKRAGVVEFEWKGQRDNGQTAAPGTYTVRIDANINGTITGLNAAVEARVDSVTLGRNGLPPTLNVDGYGAIAIADVIEIK